MRHKKQNNRSLRIPGGPRNALLRTLAIALIENGKITTTPTKAKAIQKFVEPLITKGKTKSVTSIRHIEQRLANKKATMHVVNTLGPRFAKRAGGYTTIMHTAPRKGDGAKQVILAFVE